MDDKTIDKIRDHILSAAGSLRFARRQLTVIKALDAMATVNKALGHLTAADTLLPLTAVLPGGRARARVYGVPAPDDDLETVQDAEGVTWTPKRPDRELWTSTLETDHGSSSMTLEWHDLVAHYGPLREVEK